MGGCYEWAGVISGCVQLFSNNFNNIGLANKSAKISTLKNTLKLLPDYSAVVAL